MSRQCYQHSLAIPQMIWSLTISSTISTKLQNSATYIETDSPGLQLLELKKYLCTNLRMSLVKMCPHLCDNVIEKDSTFLMRRYVDATQQLRRIALCFPTSWTSFHFAVKYCSGCSMYVFHSSWVLSNSPEWLCVTVSIETLVTKHVVTQNYWTQKITRSWIYLLQCNKMVKQTFKYKTEQRRCKLKSSTSKCNTKKWILFKQFHL